MDDDQIVFLRRAQEFPQNRIAMNMRVVLDELRRSAKTGDSLTVVGGGGESMLWRQMYADIFGLTIRKTNIGQNAASLGAVATAAVGAGLWPSFDRVAELLRIESESRPISEYIPIYTESLERFRRATGYLADFALGR